MHHLIGYLTSHLPGRAPAPRDRGDTDPVLLVFVMTGTALILLGITVPIWLPDIIGDC